MCVFRAIARSFLLVCILSSFAFGQDDAEPITAETAQALAEEAALAGHNAWMLTCSALVLFMTAPGLAMFLLLLLVF